MHFTVIASSRARHQLAHQSAMADGLKSLGCKVTLAHHRGSNTRHVACWGWRVGRALKNSGHDVLIMERGYLGDRFAWTSLAWNGLNGRGRFAPAPEDNGQRFAQYHSARPWKKGGDYVLIMGQVPGDASLQGRDLFPWYEKTALQCAAEYGLPVMFRPHPLAAKRGGRSSIKNAKTSTGDLNQALAGAAVVVTWNSNSGVDAVVQGVPTVVTDRGSMAWDVASHNIGEIKTPCRKDWANDLAWKQWRIDEIQNGSALKNLLSVADG